MKYYGIYKITNKINGKMYIGQHSPMKGKHHSEETRKKLSEKRKVICRLNPTAQSKNKGKHWYNNGVKNKLAFECPKGYTEGRI